MHPFGHQRTSYLQIGGILTIAGGVGVLIAAFFVGLQFPVAKLPMLGAAALAVCIGAGSLPAAGGALASPIGWAGSLAIAAWSLRRAYQKG